VLADLAEAVRAGKVDPVDLVQESLRRIEAANGVLNAVTALRARWGDVHGRTELDELAEQVAAGKSDPYRAADALLDSFTELDQATS